MLPNDKTFNGNYYYEENGNTFFRYQRIDKKGKYQIKVRFVSVNSPYKQGIAFKFSRNPEFRGDVYINGVKQSKPKNKNLSYVIREGYYADNEFEIELLLEEGFIAFSSASNFLGDYPGLVDMVAQKTGKEVEQLESKGFTSGFTAASRYGNAFWVETLPDKHYRFHCNDHFMDDDFDDLIFDVMVEYLAEDIKTLK